ncbi:MAG: PDZ domain-containing protein [Gallionella sp.]|nr:PDZ domain-containing protein [Gallionella sp.]
MTSSMCIKAIMSGVKVIALLLLLQLPFSSAHAELPLSVQTDLLKHELITAIKANDAVKIVNTVRKMRAKNIDTGSEVYFYEARAYFDLKNNLAGDVALENYVKEAGPQGANYQEAIAMLSDRLGKRDQEQREREAAAAHAAEIQKKWSAFNAVSVRIGKIESINTDWGFAKASLSVGHIPDGSFLYIQISPENYQPVQPGKRAENYLTLTGIGSAQFPIGAALMASTVQAPLKGGNAEGARSTTLSGGVKGVRVLSVAIGSTAARAGLRAGDIIMVYGELVVHDVRALNAAIAKRGVKTTVTERIDSNGNPVAKGLQSAGVFGGLAAAIGAERHEVREREMSQEELLKKRNSLFGGVGDKVSIGVWRENAVAHIQLEYGPFDAELTDSN